MKNQIGFEEISSEIDVLIKIFKYLRFEDQLRFAQVNVLAHHVFRTYICKVTYQKLEIKDHGSLHVLVRNKCSTNSLYLNQNLFHNFLQVFAADVRDLAIDCLETVDCMAVFRNLQSLRIDKTCLPLHFDVIVAQCPQLRRLEVMVHSLDMPGAYKKRLREMRFLKALQLTVHADLEFQDFRDFVTNLKIDCLQLKASIKYEEVFNKKTEMLMPRPPTFCLTGLDVVLSRYEQYPNPKTMTIFSCLIYCENLQQLCLQMTDLVLEDDALQLICQHCNKLQALTLRNTVCRIDCFTMPKEINEVCFIRCEGLTSHNLSQVLSQLNIRQFTSIETQYEGAWQHFHMMPYIECLKCDAINTLTLLSATERSLQSLKELTWYCPDPATDDSPLANLCPQLETINIESRPLSLSTLGQLKNVTTLRFQNAAHLNWSYIVTLLKRATIKELCFDNAYSGQAILGLVDFHIRGFATRVQTIRIREGSVISTHIDFWLDLLARNGHLKLIWFNIFGMRRFLKCLLKSRYFPKDLQIINISGINIRCNDLRRSFNDTVMEFSFLNFANRQVTLCKNYF